MLLADTEIRREIVDGGLVVRPCDLDTAIQPASIDLRLGPELLILTPNGVVEHHLCDQGPYRIWPHTFLLAATLEHFEIGPHLAGELVGKSTRAREGLVIEAAGYFDPGWKGVGTLEISCRSPLGATLTLGMPIAQLRIHPIFGVVARPYGSEGLKSHYQGSRGPKLAWTHQKPVRLLSAP